MEEENKYSDAIKFHGWPDRTESGVPVNWKLARDDENQVEANIEALEINKQYLKDKLNDTPENSFTDKR